MASPTVTLFGNTTIKQWYKVQDIAKKEGYFKGTKCKELCKAYVAQGTEGIKLEKRTYWIREDKLELFKKPEKIPKKKVEQPAMEAPHLLLPIDNKVSDKTNLKTKGSHKTIVQDIEEKSRKSASKPDEMEIPEKPAESKGILHDPLKAKAKKRRKRRRRARRTTPPKNLPNDPNKNWFLMNQRIRYWEHYNDIKTKAVFLHLLILASYTHKPYTDSEGNRYELGKVITSVGKIADENGISSMEVRTILKNLVKSGEIKILSTSKNPTKGTIIKVENYAFWQPQLKEKTQPAKTTQPPQPPLERKASWNELTHEQREARAKEAFNKKHGFREIQENDLDDLDDSYFTY